MTQESRSLAAAAYNTCWDLLEQPPGDTRDRELVASAFASRLHWSSAGGPAELAIADWMVSRACAASGNPRLAVLYAEAALARVQDDFPHWLRASMHEGMARAQKSAGLSPDASIAAAHADLALEADPEDAALIAGQLAELA